MRTVIIGGTFNPVHNGHLYISEELRIQMNYEQIVFVPSNIPAHKSVPDLVPANQRLDMLELALEGNNSLVDSCEIARGGVSYMIDTVTDINKRYKITGPVGLYIGDDLLCGMKDWHNIDELLNAVDIIVAHRESEKEIETDIAHKYLNNVTINISSTDIRNRIKIGQAYRYLVPEKVYNYISVKDLYRKNV